MPNRREAIVQAARLAALLGGAGLLPAAAQAAYEARAFDANTLGEIATALGVAAPAASKDVQLTAPDVAENGAIVAMSLACSLPGVRRLMLVVEKNPSVLAALFDIPEGTEASIATRVKMAQSSDVYAVAVLGDGRVLFAKKDVRVTLGGCG